LLRALQSLFGDRYAIVETAAYNASEEERANLQRQVARLESDLASNPTEVAKQRALLAVVTKIRESLDLEIIFQSTATEVRQLLDADRVGIYRFDPEVGWSKGLFVSEDVRPPYHSILGFQINDDCFAREHGVYYQRGRMWVVEDFDQIEIQDCHRSVVERLGFKANLVVPLLRGDRLWGLLTLHQCSQPRQWKDSEIEFIRQIALHLGIAVQHAEALRQVQNQSEHLTSAVSKAVEREKTVATAIEKIRRSLDLETIFSRTTQEVRQLLGVDRVAIYRFYPNWSGEFIFESVAEGWNPLVGPSIKTVWEDTHLQETQGGRYRNGETFVVEDIYTADLTDCHQEILEQFQVKAFCVVPVFSGEELWGLLGAYQNDRIRHWEQAEIDLLVQIGNQFGVAVRQAASVVKLRFKSEQLAASVERERAVAAIIDKIRRPLDLDTVFTTTAQEVRQLLKADRVGVFRFNTEQKDEGEFVAEAVSDGWTSAMAQKVYDSCFGERFAPDYAKGRIQAVADINDAGLSDCHVEILAQFQVRANLVVPLLQGTYLWGLLCIHQCQRPRQWQESEVEFAEQIGAQLSIAIQQAEFLSQTAQRKEELQTALTAQLKQRSEELLQEAERERASALVIDKIRQTLDLETIFQTATTEIRQLLNTDRVAVFRFDPGSNWKSGECISEDVAAKFVSAIALKVRDRCFGEKHATYYQKQQVWHVDDVQTAGLRDCHREMLEGFQVRSNLVAPLFKGDILWGLLCIHQCSGPRQWQAVEIEFATKIAANLGVAIQQAGLLAQTQRRSLQLQTTLADLNAIVDNLADGLLVTDVLGRITRFNPALLEMFALDNADLKGQSLAESFPLDLAMHFKHPDWEIALVFFTRSLYDAIVTVVDRWMRRFSNGEVAYDPNKNNKLKVLHAWGAKQQPGFYSTLCAAQGMRPRTPGAVATKQPIKGLAELCKRLLEETAIEPIFDAILIDEGQDFVVEDALKFQDKQPIYWLAYQALRPSDPEHPEQRRLIWAYDEVQSLDSLKIPTAKELFGNDSVWRTALSGAYQGGIQKSEIMRRCYRTPSTILTAAHGIGMGLLRPGGMLSGITRADEWRAIGYEVSGQFRSGQQIVLHRPSETAPNPVEELWGEPVLEFETYSTRQEELEALAANIRDNLEVDRLNPSRDILVIILGTAYDAIELENRTANFLSERGIDIYIPTALHLNEINPKYPQRDPDRFWFDGGVTISRIPRAKGNEADMVYIIGLEQIARNESEVSLRNQLFVALTRARGWVSLSGVGNYEMYREMRQTIDSGNTLTFTYKSPLKRRLDEE